MPNFSGMWTVTQQMQAKGQNIWPAVIPVVGSAFGGGFFAGQISTAGNGIADYNLVVGPAASAQTSAIQYKNANTDTPGTNSLIDGPQLTADAVADGNATVYPAAHFCNNLVTGGQTDWYLPAQNELEVCYFNLKPTTQSNTTSYGINVNAVPARASNYTAGNPAQTTATDFRSTGAEDFLVDQRYWTSTKIGTTSVRCQYFTDGLGAEYGKTNVFNLRAIRRVAV